MFRSFGPMEIGVVLVIILIIFGVGKLPQVGGAIGKSIREFRKATHSEPEDEKSPDFKSKMENQEKEEKS